MRTTTIGVALGRLAAMLPSSVLLPQPEGPMTRLGMKPGVTGRWGTGSTAVGASGREGGRLARRERSMRRLMCDGDSCR